MSEDYDEFEEIHLASEDEFVKINQYNKGKGQNSNNSQVEQTAFEELENIMNRQQNHSSRRELLLQEKLHQMQSKCQTLFNTNSYLTKRIEQMHIQYQEYVQSEIDLRQLQQFLGEVQKEVQLYRKEWAQFKEKQDSLNQKRIGQFQQLIQTIQTQKQQIQLLKIEKSEIIHANNTLESNNLALQQEVSVLERELKEQRTNRQKSTATRSYSRHNTTSAFQDEVQAELQQLIQKLMAELQFERQSHKKSMTEIKRMQQQIMQLEREIVSKNNKIYELQMDNLKGYKYANKNVKKRQVENERSREEPNEGYKSKSDRSSQSVLKSFTIQQMLSGSIELSERERYIIASKVIQFYLKKIENNDLVPYNSDKLMISNYNKINPSLIMIRKLQSPPYNGQLSLRTLGWNLGVILSSLLIEYRQDAQYRDENDEFLGTTIESLLRQRLTDASQLYSLKEVVDETIKASR